MAEKTRDLENSGYSGTGVFVPKSDGTARKRFAGWILAQIGRVKSFVASSTRKGSKNPSKPSARKPLILGTPPRERHRFRKEVFLEGRRVSVRDSPTIFDPVVNTLRYQKGSCQYSKFPISLFTRSCPATSARIGAKLGRRIISARFSGANPLTNTVQIRGDGKIIQIEVFGYERPDAIDADDANWLKARCSVTVAEFSATLSLSLVAHDFARFAHELEEAIQLLKGTATFSTAEAGLGIEIKFTTAGHADVFGSVRSQTSFVPDQSVLSFSFETDQSFLAQTVRELKTIVSQFPVRNG